MRKIFYKISSDRFDKNIRLALVSDLHAQSYKQPMRLVKEESPDYILFGGDIFEALDGSFEKKNRSAKLCSVIKRAAVFSNGYGGGRPYRKIVTK